MRKKILFVAMTGKMIGMGHIKRSHVLMQDLIEQKKCETQFIIYTPDTDLEYNPNHLVVYEQDKVYQTLFESNASVIVFDMPIQFMELGLFKKLRLSGKKTVVIDDSNEFQFCDSIDLKVSCSIKFIEKTRMGEHGNTLFGPDYIILSSDYQKYAMKQRDLQTKLKRVLLSFGGSDPNQITEKVLSIFNMCSEKQDDLHLDVILGKYANAIPDSLLDSSRHRITISRDVNNMSKRLWDADLAIISGGMTLYEACSVGTPTITVNQNDEQEEEGKFFNQLGAILNGGMHNQLSSESFHSIFNKVRDLKVRIQLSSISKTFIDGQGAERITRKLLTL